MRKALIGGAMMGAALALAGCSSAGTAGKAQGGSTSPSVSSSSTAGSGGGTGKGSQTGEKSHTSAITFSPAKFGTTLTGTDRGLIFRIRLTKLLDPARPVGSRRAVPKGERLVGAKFVISEVKGLLYDDVEKDTLLIGGDNRTYEPSLSPVSGCRELSSIVLKKRASITGCVGFLLPKGVRVRVVEFQANAGSATNIEAWKV